MEDEDILFLMFLGFMMGVVLTFFLMLIIIPEPDKTACNYMGELLDNKTVLVDNTCYVEESNNLTTLESYLGLEGK